MKRIAILTLLTIIFLLSSCKLLTNQNVTYTVNHYLQNVDDDEYTLYEKETLSGITGDKTQIVAKEYKGFTVKGFNQETITNNTSISLKYDRNLIECDLQFNGGKIIDENNSEITSISVSGRYGAEIITPEPFKNGYILDGWYDADGNELNSYFEVSGTYYANYVSKTTANYSIHFYFQNVEDDYYTEDVRIAKNAEGKTGTLTNVEAPEVTGFNAKSIEQKTIAADNSTEVKVYYDRKIITLNFNLAGGSGNTTISKKYGTVINNTIIPDPVKNNSTFSGWNPKLPDSFTENGEFVAVWDMPYYKVNYLFENLNDSDFSEDLNFPEEKYYGEVNKTTEFVPKTIPGFVAQPVTQKTIEQDNSTVLTVSYKRKIITLYIDLKNGVGTSFIQGKFGQDHSVVKEKLSQLQIPNRAGFDLDSEDIYELPDDLAFTLENDETTQIFVKWIGGKSTVYTVVILKENLDYKTEDERYSIYNKIRIDGISGEKTELVINTINNSVKAGENNFIYTGFTPQEVKNLEINGDASTVIYVYFNRNVTTITYNLNGGNISGNTSSVTISGKYGAAVTNIPSDIEREGCSSYVWDKTITKFQPTDTIINAVWTGKNYTVTYHNGSQTEQKEYTYLKDYMVPSLSDFSTLTLEDGGFSGWKLNENDDNSTFFTGNSFTLPEPKNYDLYADIETHFYTVKYYLENIVDDNYTVDSSEKVYAKPGTTTNFLPVDKTGFTVNTFDQITVSEDNSSLIEVKYKRNLYTVSFDLQGGYMRKELNGYEFNSIPSVSLKYGSNYTVEFYDIFRSGYYYKEMKWIDLDDRSFTLDFDGSYYGPNKFTISNISKNLNLKLSGTPQVITCTLKNLNDNGNHISKDGESFNATFNFTVESKRIELPELELDGYDFLGWYVDFGLTNKYTKTDIPTGTVYQVFVNTPSYIRSSYTSKTTKADLYAKWRSKTGLTESSIPKNVGDIVLKNGKVINIPNIEGIEVSLTNEQKNNAIGVITHNMGSDASPNWRLVGRYKGETKWKDSYRNPMYVRDADGNDLMDSKWSGKDDGYNGLTYYTKQIDSPNEYPIWGFVKNYKNNYNVTLKESYQNQWYVPSTTEMSKMYTNYSRIKYTLGLLDSNISSDEYWSCNIQSNWDNTPVYTFDFNSGKKIERTVNQGGNISVKHNVFACHKF